MTTDQPNGMSTVAIHAGQEQQAQHAHITPIFATSTFTFDSAEQGMNRFTGKEPGFTYSRFGNPTAAVAEELIASLEAFRLQDEHGQPLHLKALMHASGQAAMTTMFLSNLTAGDAVLASQSLYGGTHEFLGSFLPGFGVQTHFADLRDLNLAEDFLQKHPSIKLIHLETPANPTMQCVDIEAVCKLAKQYGKKVTVDNTFATPYLQQPSKYGADFVFHSTTKFLNGHGSAIGGVLIGRDVEYMKTKVHRVSKLLGGTGNPFDAFLLIQGIKTLPLRMQQHCSNAMLVAQYLEQHPAIAKVNYNGLESHPDYTISQKQMKHAGAVLSFELKDGFDVTVQFINKLKVCVRAVSLGTTDTLVSHPASMSHSGMSREERLQSGVTDGLVRMSVGLEDIQDLLADLEQALK